MMPKVSVLIPVYNVESYLNRCLNSVCNQTLTDIEIIIVNDGSTDNSKVVLEYYEQKDKRIIVIHKENNGLASARNAAIEVAKGEYLSFIDSDDWVDLNMLKEMYELGKSTSSDIVVCNMSKAFSERKIVPSKSLLSRNIDKINDNEIDFNKISENCWSELSYRYLFELKGASVCNKLYRREFVKDNNLRSANLKIGEDLFLNLNSLIYKPKITFLDKVFYYYFVNQGSITNNFAKNQSIDFAYQVETFIANAKKKSLFSRFEKFLPLIIFRGYSIALNNIFLRNNKLSDIYKSVVYISSIKLFKDLFVEGYNLKSYKLINNKIKQLLFSLDFLFLSKRLLLLESMMQYLRFYLFNKTM